MGSRSTNGRWSGRWFVVGLAIVLAGSVVFADELDDRVVRLNELLKDIPSVVAERRADIVVVTGWTRNKDEKKILDKAVDIVGDVQDFTGADIDDPDRMVEIDVAIVVVLNTDETSVGFNFLKLIDMSFEYFSTTNRSDEAYGLRSPGSYGNVLAGTQWGRLFNAKVEYHVNIANAQDSRVNIIARPHLATLNGQKAEFMAGGEIVFKVSGLNSGRIQPYPFGINLTVTPTVLRTRDADGKTQVLLDVDASRTTVLGVRTISGAADGDQDVSFDKLQVKSKALLPMDETLILSGLYQREHREVLDGVPFLRRIPIIKYFFSNRAEVDEVLSTVIFITPRNPGILNESTQSELDAFIKRRTEYLNSRDAGDEAIKAFQEKYDDWYQPRHNRYASHVFLVQNSRVFRELRGEDLRTEEIRRDIMNVDSAD